MSGPRSAVASAAPVDDPRALRQLFGHVPSGLVTVAALGADGPVGVVVSSFTSVSLDPPLVSVNIGRSSSTLPVLRAASRWGLSVLAEDQGPVADRFRLPAAERFRDLDWIADSGGAVHVVGAVATLTTTPVNVIAAGDHDIAILALTDYTHPATARRPLVFHRSRFHRLDRSSHQEILR